MLKLKQISRSAHQVSLVGDLQTQVFESFVIRQQGDSVTLISKLFSCD